MDTSDALSVGNIYLESNKENIEKNEEFYTKDKKLIQGDFKGTQVQIGENETIRKLIEEQGISEESDNTNLESLRLNIEGLLPEFEKNIYTYYLTIPNEIRRIEVSTNPENSNAVVEVNGNTNLQEGLNYITIKVVSEDKQQSKIYTIQVTKTENPELANTNLETLAIENTLLYPSFNNNIINYKAEVSNNVEDLKILAIPENEKAKVKILGTDEIKEGNNLININVTAPNGFTQRVYEINVYKRNQEEEIKYNDEQEVNQDQLEQIYKTEKASIDVIEKQENNNKMEIIILGIVAVLIVTLIAKKIFLRKKL